MVSISYLTLLENENVVLVIIDFVYSVDILIIRIRMKVYFEKKKK